MYTYKYVHTHTAAIYHSPMWGSFRLAPTIYAVCHNKCVALISITHPPYSLSAHHRLLPDQKVYSSSEHALSLEACSVGVEVTTFEPMQNLLVSWEFKVRV